MYLYQIRIGMRVSSKEGTLQGVVLDMEEERPKRVYIQWDTGRTEWLQAKDIKKE